MPKATSHVDGVPEAQAAFKKFGKKLDYSLLAEAAADEMIPDIRANTRVKSGAMQQGWGIIDTDKEAYFINDEDYWTFQEFGTEFVTPTNAIIRSWHENEKAVKKAYDKGIKEVAEDAGFEQRG